MLSLFGIEDTAAIDRVRGEWACGWIDEASPTLEDGGVSELAFDVLATSLRVPTHTRIKLVTENFPEESHWTWKRWAPTVGAWGVGYHPDDRQRMTIMIPKGDSPHITEADRREWAQALKDRPDLAARLLEGRPGSVQLGQAVAEGFNESAHVSRTRLEPYRGEPFVIGQDFGLTPATVIGQFIGGRLFIYAALCCERGGIRQHFEHTVRPWFGMHAPWALSNSHNIEGAYDPAGNTPAQNDIDQSPILTVEQLLPGFWDEGSVSWEGRKGPMLALFNRAVAGEPALQIDPVDGLPLIRALRGGWYYQKDRYSNVSRDLPKKSPTQRRGRRLLLFGRPLLAVNATA